MCHSRVVAQHLGVHCSRLRSTGLYRGKASYEPIGSSRCQGLPGQDPFQYYWANLLCIDAQKGYRTIGSVHCGIGTIGL